LECFDCGTTLSERDLLVACCQICGDPLLPDDLDALRAELGIAEAKPPEIINPIIESKPLEIPDAVDCPGCFTPLMVHLFQRLNQHQAKLTQKIQT